MPAASRPSIVHAYERDRVTSTEGGHYVKLQFELKGLGVLDIVIKQAVIFGAHTDLRWDKKLYEIKWMSPIMWILERTISTPSTHWMHHGKHLSDENTHYKGNYGNLLFIWDIIFGTAKITREYPKEVGVENLSEVSALTQLFWPIFRSPQEPETEKV